MTSVLNLSFYKAIEEDIHENETAKSIPVKTTLPPTHCPKCQSIDFVKHGARETRFMDIPNECKHTAIRVIRQRYRCKDCGNVFIDPLFGMDEDHMMTSRLVRHIEETSITETFAHLAHEIGVDEKVIRNIFMAHIRRLQAQYKVQTPEWLGIDEIHLLGAPRCILTNVREKTMIDLLKTRKKPVVELYLMKLPNRQRVQVVTMDMWSPYREAVESTLPGAKIVVDRYHVVRMANKGLDEYRKALKEGMTTSQRRQLMRDRHVLLKRKNELEPKELLLLAIWLDNIPSLKIAYELKEMFCEIYEIQGREKAEEQYRIWFDTLSANPEIVPHFEELTIAINNWHTQIFNYFDFKATNAYTESMNSLIRMADRIGRGYSFEAIRGKMLFRNGHKYKSFKQAGGRSLKMYQFGQQPEEVQEDTYLGVPLSTLTEMLEHHEL